MKPQAKALLITITIISIIAISVYLYRQKKDFTKVTVGMTTEQVEKEVGKPDKSQNFIFGLKLLIYDEGYIIVIENEKVVNKMTQEQFAKGMEPAIENLEKAKKGMQEWEVKKKEIDKKMNDFQNSLN